MAIYVRDHIATAEPEIFKLRCPTCRHAGAFHGYKGCNDVSWGSKVKTRTVGGNYHLFSKAGTRQYPNPDCGALVFIAFDSRDETLTTYPPEVIDFDATDLPANILATLKEAVACHAAGAFEACSPMVRRVLEELREDKGAKGGNLKQRIEGLKAVAIIPDELLSAADELRILGNDSSHVEAMDYDYIGKDEALIAIDIAKELLKATYQYTSLVARLKVMKKPSPKICLYTAVQRR